MFHRFETDSFEVKWSFTLANDEMPIFHQLSVSSKNRFMWTVNTIPLHREISSISSTALSLYEIQRPSNQKPLILKVVTRQHFCWIIPIENCYLILDQNSLLQIFTLFGFKWIHHFAVCSVHISEQCTAIANLLCATAFVLGLSATSTWIEVHLRDTANCTR